MSNREIPLHESSYPSYMTFHNNRNSYSVAIFNGIQCNLTCGVTTNFLNPHLMAHLNTDLINRLSVALNIIVFSDFLQIVATHRIPGLPCGH